MIIGIVSRPGGCEKVLAWSGSRYASTPLSTGIFYVPLSLHIKILELTGRVVRSSDPDGYRDCIETGSAARKSRRCQVLDMLRRRSAQAFFNFAIAPLKNTRTDRKVLDMLRRRSVQAFFNFAIAPLKNTRTDRKVLDTLRRRSVQAFFMFRFATHKKHSVLDMLRRRSVQAFLSGAPLCLKTLELTGRGVRSSEFKSAVAILNLYRDGVCCEEVSV